MFDLCINAAGGSKVLQIHGPAIITALREGKAKHGWAAAEGESTLSAFAEKLGAAVAEGQRLKVPLYLGNQALGLITQVLRSGPSSLAAGSVVKAWTA